MKRVSFLVLIFLLLIAGCGLDNKTKQVGSYNKDMPTEMPRDFNFSVKFGIQKKNEINTFEDIVTKDLVVNGTATAKLTFTADEMNKIYEKMKDINITETKNLMPKTNCRQEPYDEEEWKIKINGETITLYMTEKYCKTTNDGKQLMELRNYILDIVKSKDEYRNLPEAKGGYD